MLKKFTGRPEGGGHRSVSTPLNMPLIWHFGKTNILKQREYRE